MTRSAAQALSVPTCARPRRRGAVAPVSAVLVALLGLLGLVAGLAGPAAAHDSLVGTTPADGATVDAPPASIDLTFTEPPLGLGAAVQVTGPDGTVVNDGDLTITDTVVSQPLAADLPAGAYAVAWRVTSSDGHPISGELAFTATAGTVPEPTATVSEPAAEPSDPTEASAGPTTEPEPVATASSPDASPSPDAADPGVAQEADRASALPWVIAAVVLLVAAGALVWARRRRAGAGQG